MMKLLLLIIEIVIISTACASDIQKFRDAKIIPDIIDDFEASKMLNVTFLVPLEGGAQLTPNEVRSEPEVSWDAMEGDFYSILMTDCGVHSEDVVEVRNWLVMNIPGSDVSKGETIAEFIGAMPMEVILKNKYFTRITFTRFFNRTQACIGTFSCFSFNRVEKSTTWSQS